MISVKDIRALYKIFEDSEVGEVEIQSEEKKFRFSIGQPAPVYYAPPAPAVSGTSTAGTSHADLSLPSNVSELSSRWVGFFTRLNPKTGEYYIKLRDKVKAGQVLAHVRVLGVLQDIKAEKDGKVKEILVEEGQPIEYGQPVMRFEV